MSPKTINILYWIFTIIFAGLMIFSSVGGIGPTQEVIDMFHTGLGYPIYFIQFISWAKIIGAITILIPGLNKTIKEWAYAGLFFDLVGAVYSGLAVGGFDPMMLTMLLWFVFGIASYALWLKQPAKNKLHI